MFGPFTTQKVQDIKDVGGRGEGGGGGGIRGRGAINVDNRKKNNEKAYKL